LTFALGLGAAMNAPAWQAVIPELVTRDELPAAVALGGVAMNVARAVGPALGGLLVSALGPGGVFLLNATSFLGVVVVLARLPIDRLLAIATVLFAIASAGLAVAPNAWLAGLAMLVGGVGWILMMSTVSVAAQHAVPAWVRARALAMSLLVIQGGLALGSVM